MTLKYIIGASSKSDASMPLEFVLNPLSLLCAPKLGEEASSGTMAKGLLGLLEYIEEHNLITYVHQIHDL